MLTSRVARNVLLPIRSFQNDDMTNTYPPFVFHQQNRDPPVVQLEERVSIEVGSNTISATGCQYLLPEPLRRDTAATNKPLLSFLSSAGALS